MKTKIADLRWVITDMPNQDPEWRFALGAHPRVHGVAVEITSDAGTCGYGYTNELLHIGHSLHGIVAVLEILRPHVVGQCVADIAPILSVCDGVVSGNWAAKAAIDVALHDLLAKTFGLPVYQLLGGRFRARVPVVRILALKGPAEMADGAERLAREGYEYLKIKVEGDVAADMARIGAVRERVGPSMHLTLDANQSYTPKEATRLLRMVEAQGYNIDLMEQPVRADDLDGLAQVTHSTHTTVEADEAVQSLGDVLRLIRMGAADAICLKVPKLGGIRKCQEAAVLCEAANVRYRVGATFGSRILNAAGCHLAVALRQHTYAAELGEFHHLDNDVARGLAVEGGHIAPTDGLGLGITVRVGEA